MKNRENPFETKIKQLILIRMHIQNDFVNLGYKLCKFIIKN